MTEKVKGLHVSNGGKIIMDQSSITVHDGLAGTTISKKYDNPTIIDEHGERDMTETELAHKDDKKKTNKTNKTNKMEEKTNSKQEKMIKIGWVSVWVPHNFVPGTILKDTPNTPNTSFRVDGTANGIEIESTDGVISVMNVGSSSSFRIRYKKNIFIVKSFKGYMCGAPIFCVDGIDFNLDQL
jgi:hypothetical protein